MKRLIIVLMLFVFMACEEATEPNQLNKTDYSIQDINGTWVCEYVTLTLTLEGETLEAVWKDMYDEECTFDCIVAGDSLSGSTGILWGGTGKTKVKSVIIHILDYNTLKVGRGIWRRGYDNYSDGYYWLGYKIYNRQK